MIKKPDLEKLKSQLNHFKENDLLKKIGAYPKELFQKIQELPLKEIVISFKTFFSKEGIKNCISKLKLFSFEIKVVFKKLFNLEEQKKDLFFFWKKKYDENNPNEHLKIDLEKRVNLKIVAASSFIINILALAMPIMMLQTYDRILPYRGIPSLVMLIVGVTLALSFEVILKILRSYIAGSAGAVFEHTTACQAIDNLLSAEFKEIEETGSGIFLKRMQAISKLRGFYSGQTLMTVIDLPFTFIYLSVIWLVGKSIVLVPISLIIIFVAIVGYLGKKLKNDIKDRDDFIDYKTNILVQILEGIHSVKALGAELFFIRKSQSLRSKLSQSYYKISVRNNMISNLGAVLAQLMTVLVVAFGCIQVYHMRMGMGGLAAIVMLSGRVIQPVAKALGLWTRFQEFNIAQNQVKELFNYTIEKDCPLPKDYECQGHLILKDVHYSIGQKKVKTNTEFVMDADDVDYVHTIKNKSKLKLDSNALELTVGENKIKILDGINLNIKRGEAIAISTSKGLGKTTLLNIIAGFYRPDSGSVTLDGIDLHTFPKNDLYKELGYISEIGEILVGTVRENLTFFGKIPMEDAMDAAEKFGIDESIAVLSKGWETMLHNSPADLLPPGLKQRICIARVLAQHPSILLIDNADVSLDIEGYRHLFSVLGKLKNKISLIMITEDRNFIELADTEYHFVHGKLVKQKKSHFESPLGPRAIA